MGEDQGSGERDIGDESGCETTSINIGKVTRRELLVGGASTLVASQAFAAGQKLPYLDVSYEDATRRGLVIAWVESAISRYEWHLSASTFAESDLHGGGRFVLRRTPNGWRALLARCAFPGGYQFDLTIEAVWDPVNNPTTPSLTFTVGKDITLTPKSLIAFLKVGSKDNVPIPNQADEIFGSINNGQLAALVKSLFGNTFEYDSATGVRVAFHHGGYWILRAGKKLAKGETESSSERKNRFAALSGEGVALRFREIAFNIFTGTSGGTEAVDAFEIKTQTDPVKEDVRALFSGDGAPLPDLVTPGSQTPPRVLYGLVRHNEANDPKAVGDDVWSGTVALGKAPGGETASLKLLNLARPNFLSWRNSGDGYPVLALQTSASLVIQRAAGATASEFEETSVRLWRAFDKKKTLRIVASLTPQLPVMYVNTRFGPFTVAPLPSLSPRPGTTARVPTIRVGSSGPKNNRMLSHFAAPLALESAAINLTSEGLGRLLDDSEPLDNDQTALRNETHLFSQLTFSEAECLFRIKDVALRYSWGGDLAPMTDPPQTEAIIHIGDIKDLSFPVRIALNRATLMVRRPADLLALTFRFQDLVLERGNGGWSVKPDRRLAAFLSSGQPIPDPGAPLICDDKAPAANDPARYQQRADPRPLLVVEFPPQHIAEQAFFRRLQPDPKLPVPPARGEATPDEAEILRTGSLAERMQSRAAVKARQDKIGQQLPPGKDKDDWDRFVKFRTDFETAVKTNANIPVDQQTYIGPAFLDIETARIARDVQRKIEAGLPAGNAADEIVRLLRDVPDVDLPPTVIRDLRKQYGIADNISEDYPVPETTIITEWLKTREDLKTRNDSSYKPFADFYGKNYDERAKILGLTPDLIKGINDYQTALPQPFRGRRNLVAIVKNMATANEAVALLAARAIAATVAAFDVKTENEEPLQIPAEARASGGSRLVFRIPADDFEGGRPDNIDGASAGSFPFTIEALTNWGAFDLAVVRRAEKVFEPLGGWLSSDPDVAKNWPSRPYGRLRPRWARQETRDEAAKLRHQGITRGDSWALRHDEQRNLTGQSSCPVPLARLGSVTAAQRMTEVVAGIREPSLYETSIEMPFRLMLSPAQDAAWRTPLELPPELKLLPAARRIAPLWFAQLDETPGASSVRAVWSPDFRPEALLDADLGGPPHGPWAPWAMARDVTARRPYLENEPVYAQPDPTFVCKATSPPGPNCKFPEKFRTGLDVSDRHELVALTSLYGLPVRGRRNRDGTLTDGSQIDPPAGFKLRHAAKEALDDSQPDIKDDYSAIYRPQPLGVTEMTLTALGGSFDADTNFVPPASAKIVPTKLWTPDNKDTAAGQSLFDAFSIERWRQDTRLGRDIRAEVVYKGFLFPLGHRCSLVKLTERRFVAPIAKDKSFGGPVAFLIQRMFLRIGTPLKTFPAIGQPNGGRSWPTERLEILTRVTPDVLDPADASPANPPLQAEEATSGRIFLRDAANGPLLPGLVFWPRVRARKGGEVNFELQIDGRGARTRMPLIFVDNTAANDSNTMKALTDYYNKLAEPSTQPDLRRVLQLGGDKRRYAPESEPDGTSFETKSWIVEAEGREKVIPLITDALRNIKFNNSNFDFGSLLQGVDQPPFYPRIASGTVHIAQIDRLIGMTSPQIDVYFDAEYRAFGFPKDDALNATHPGDTAPLAKTDVYLDFVAEVLLDPDRNGERTGGPVRPNTPLVAMSRSRGPVGNRPKGSGGALTLTNPVGPRSTGLDNPSPDTFFGDATLLGIVDLKSALKFIGSGISSTPQFKEVTQYGSALLAGAENDAGAAVAKIRDQLLVPLRGALLVLAREFLQQTDANQPFKEDLALERLERLYPDVGSAYRDLKNALDAAIELSATVQEVDALIEHFATIYASGRRFIAAIDRVANDPIAPVREALREAFNTKIAGLITKVENQLNLIDLPGLVQDLTDISANIRGELAKLFVAAGFRAWRHLVLSLPGAHSLPPLLATYAQFVEDTVDKVFVNDIKGGDFIAALQTNDPTAAATVLGDAFDKAFKKQIGNATVQQAAALQAAYDAWTVGAQNDPGVRIRGLLFDVPALDPNDPDDPTKIKTLVKIKALLGAAANLVEAASNGPKNIGAICGALKEVLDALFGIVQPVLDNGESAAVTLCESMTTTFVTLFDEVLPIKAVAPNTKLFPQLDAAKKSTADEFDKAIAEIAKLNLGLEVDATKIKADIDLRLQPLVDARDALQRGAVELVKLANDICHSSPTRLQLDALAIAKRTREAFVQALNQFQISIASVDTGNIGGSLSALMLKLDATGTSGKAARAAFVKAVQEIIRAEAALCDVTREATSLGRIAGGNQALSKTRAALVALRNAIPGSVLSNRLDQLIVFIDNAKSAAAQQRANIDKAITDLSNQANAQVADLNEIAYLVSARALAATTAGTIDIIVLEIIEKFEQRIIGSIAEFLLAGEPYLNAMLSIGLAKVAPVLQLLVTAQKGLVDSRDTIWTGLGCTPAGAIPIPSDDPFGGDLSGITFKKICDLLLVALPYPMPPTPHVLRPGLNDPGGTAPDNDYLVAERNELTALYTTVNAGQFDQATLTAVSTLLRDWSAAAPRLNCWRSGSTTPLPRC